MAGPEPRRREGLEISVDWVANGAMIDKLNRASSPPRDLFIPKIDRAD